MPCELNPGMAMEKLKGVGTTRLSGSSRPSPRRIVFKSNVRGSHNAQLVLHPARLSANDARFFRLWEEQSYFGRNGLHRYE